MRRYGTLVTGLALAAAILGIVVLWCGSLTCALAIVRGSAVCIDPPSAVVAIDVGGSGHQQLTLRNVTSTPVRILGADLPCACLSLSGLPVTIAPKSSVTIDIAFSKAKPSQDFHLSFFTDNPKLSVIRAVLSVP